MKKRDTGRRRWRALVCALLGIVVLAASGCGDGDDGNTAMRPGPDVPLPTLAAAGRMPALDRRVDLMIDAEGILAVNGRVVELADLGEALIAAAGGNPSARTLREIVETVEEDEDAAESPFGTPRPRIRSAIPMDEDIEEDVEEVEDTEEVYPREVVAEEPVIRDEEIFEGPDRGSSVIGVASRPVTNAEALADGDAWPLRDDSARAANLVLWVASDVPWVAVSEVLMRAADPDVRLYRVFFAVTSQASGKTRAVAVFLPRDRGLCPTDGGDALSTLRVSFVENGLSSNAHTIGNAIRPEVPAGERVVISLSAKPGVPIQRVLDVVDGALHAGAAAFTFDGSPASDVSLVERVRTSRSDATWGVKVARTIVAGSSTGDERADWPDYAGFANDSSFLPLEEVIEETSDRDG